MKKTVTFIVSTVLLSNTLCASVLNCFDRQETMVIRASENVFQETYLLFKDGKVYKVENGEPKVLEKEIQLHNGTTVYPNGTYELKDKKQYALTEGACFDMNGSQYLNQKMLSQKRPMSADEVQKSRGQMLKEEGKAKQKE